MSLLNILKKNNLIMKIITLYFNAKSNILWKIQRNVLRNRSNFIVKVIDCNIDLRKVIVIVPHADDELIGCFHFINKYKNNIVLFYCGFTGCDDTLENKRNRLLEFEKFCKEQEIEYFISSSDIENNLSQIIKDISPSTIFLPSCIDWHYQHRECNYICYRVLKKLKIMPLIGWYQISVPIPSAFLNYAVSFNKKEQNKKWNMFLDIYISQKHIPIRRFQVAERITGDKVKKYSSEAFSIISIDEWSILLEDLNTEEVVKLLNDLYYDINDLIKISDDTENIYKKLNDRVRSRSNGNGRE